MSESSNDGDDEEGVVVTDPNIGDEIPELLRPSLPASVAKRRAPEPPAAKPVPIPRQPSRLCPSKRRVHPSARSASVRVLTATWASDSTGCAGASADSACVSPPHAARPQSAIAGTRERSRRGWLKLDIVARR